MEKLYQAGSAMTLPFLWHILGGPGKTVLVEKVLMGGLIVGWDKIFINWEAAVFWTAVGTMLGWLVVV